jgi:hypothetical protein
MDVVGIVHIHVYVHVYMYGHLVYFTATWYILWPFGKVYVNLVYFPILVFLDPQIWQPWST